MDHAPFPLIDLAGSPHERGVAHGQAAPDRIKRGIKMYAEALLKNGIDWTELERRATDMVPTIERFDPAYLEAALAVVEARWGGLDAYFEAAGIDAARRAALVAALVETPARA